MRWTHPSASDASGWVLRIGVGAFYFLFGIEKFGGGPHNSWAPMFDRIGWGQWFRIATGVIEVGGALLYVLPWTTWVGAFLLSSTMLGAILAHVMVLGDPGSSFVPAVALVATMAIALREPDEELLRVLPGHRDVTRKPGGTT